MIHPITPSQKLVDQWADDATLACPSMNAEQWESRFATKAAQWGADQELEACCEYVYERLKLTTIACIAQELRDARRPKPPSLKEQALLALSHLVKGADESMDTMEAAEYVRRALEALPE